MACVPSPAACLIDVYETALSCDFAGHRSELPAIAGVSVRAWNAAFDELIPAVIDGRLSMGDAYAQVVRSCDREPTPDLLGRLVQRDRELVIETSRLHDDTIPFLEMLRDRGIATAFVSNCAENTRPLLTALGLSELVDALVLSCEVRSVKPSARIFQVALDRLGVSAASAIFVDDQPAFCAGASALGIEAVLISRDGAGSPEQPETATVKSLLDLEIMF